MILDLHGPVWSIFCSVCSCRPASAADTKLKIPKILTVYKLKKSVPERAKSTSCPVAALPKCALWLCKFKDRVIAADHDPASVWLSRKILSAYRIGYRIVRIYSDRLGTRETIAKIYTRTPCACLAREYRHTRCQGTPQYMHVYCSTQTWRISSNVLALVSTARTCVVLIARVALLGQI